jgi:hypothetical protein
LSTPARATNWPARIPRSRSRPLRPASSRARSPAVGARPSRAGLGAARIGSTVYVVGGYGTGFVGTNRLEVYTPPA